MDKRFLYWAGISAALFLSVIFLRNYFKGYSDLPGYAERISHYVRQAEDRTGELLDNGPLISKLCQENGQSTGLQERELTYLEGYYSAPFTICIYKDNQLLYWTNNRNIPEPEDLRRISEEPELHKTGPVYLWSRKIPLSSLKDSAGVYAVLLIPVKYEFYPERTHFKNHFPTSEKIPAEIRITKVETQYPVSLNDAGLPDFYLQSFRHSGANGRSWGFLLQLAAFLALCITFNRFCKLLGKRQGAFASAVVLFIGIAGIRMLLEKSGLINWFDDVVARQEAFGSASLSDSLGAILINILLLFWLLLFTYRALRLSSFTHTSQPARWWVAGTSYFAILLCMVMIAGLCKSLVLDSGIEFDFEHVFNLNAGSFLALLGIILFQLIFFVVSHRMTLTIQRLRLNLTQRLLSILAACAAVYPLFSNLDAGFSIVLFYLVAFVYLLLFDLFVESARPNITWLVIWLIVFAGFTAVILFKYSKDKDFATRQVIAERLAEPVDSSLVLNVVQTFRTLSTDQRIYSLYLSCSDSIDARNELLRVIRQSLEQNHYIGEFYSFQIAGSNWKLPPGKTSTGTDLTWLEDPERPIPSAQMLTDSFYPLPGKIHEYALRCNLLLKESIPALSVSLQLQRRSLHNQPEFSSVTRPNRFKGIPDLDHYDYAIYYRDKLLESKGSFYESRLSPELDTRSAIEEVVRNGRSELVLQSDTAYTVAVGRPLSGLIKPISLFSYLFALLVAVALLMAVLNTYFHILPEQMKFRLSSKLSLRSKIQISVLALIVFSFLFVGFVTVYYFSNSSRNYDLERLQNKALSVQFDAQSQLSRLQSDSISRADLSGLVSQLSQVHQTDINIYDTTGYLIRSSDPEIYKTGSIAPWMNSNALHILRAGSSQIYIHEQESVGDMQYKAAFIPVRDQYEHAVAFISLPYSSKLAGRENTVEEFMGTLLNVYVFLLMIAGAIAIAVANSITRPITVLGEKLKAFKLGKRNEPLHWSNNDELGALIREYNSMIDKLEKSAELLAQNEREVAWREMAKQVAHEIKNPLTPMKLSIQHLEQKIAGLPQEEIAPFVKRVASTLIEQIDNLTRIASEFSNFSKLPEPNNEKIVFNDLVASVHDLFRKRDDILFSLYVPIDEIYIFADRSHILRILNNLLKNAIQAIPADRKGRINIRLFTRDGYATLQVSDNGCGIPADMQDKVFYPNFTTKSSGTGLGLAISKDIAEAYGGRIYFSTVEDAGTDFYFELPLHYVES